MVADSDIQRIARLTPLADVLASFDLSVGPVEPREEAVSKALGLTLAASAVIAEATPGGACAARRLCRAVRRDARCKLLCAGAAVAAPARVDTGDALPRRRCGRGARRGADARRAGRALAAVAPGEGVLAPNADATAGLQLRLAGARLRRIDVALLTALGVDACWSASLACGWYAREPGDIIRGAATLIASAVVSESGVAVTEDIALEAALNDESADMVIAIGGTGSGRNDESVRTLARVGKVQFHGIGITPGETTALGFVGPRPVLLLPGRIDAALAGWLTIGRRMLARRAFRLIEEQPFAAELARKIASPLGLAEIVAVRRRLGRVEPVAQGYLSMQALAHAEGWILIPADSEGHPAGARVVVRPWP
jgi:molybdopterin biosynthesis enzyme